MHVLAGVFHLVPFGHYRTLFLDRNPLYAFIEAIDISWISKPFLVVRIKTLCGERYVHYII